MKWSASFRHWAVHSPHPLAVLLRSLRARFRHFTLPAPKVVVRPLLWIFLLLRGIVYFLRRVLFAEPLFKAYCTRHGRGVTTGIYIPWIQGRGELVVGDYVHVSGKLSVIFGARFVERPRLTIGDHTDIAHECSFVVGREVRIGRHVQIAGRVSFRDSSGHPVDPGRRKAGEPPDATDVKPIIVHDNVWIGVGALLLPGAEIGEGSIVAANAVVSGPVAAYTIVAGNPARRVGLVSPPEATAAEADAPADPDAITDPAPVRHDTTPVA